jgi:hypothetical protein
MGTDVTVTPVMTHEMRPDMQAIISHIAAIFELCQQHPELDSYTTERINALLCRLMADGQEKASTEIRQHIREKAQSDNPIHPRAKDFRMIAERLAKAHGIQFSSKQFHKKAQIMQWLDEHWLVVRDDFFMLLDNIDNLFEMTDNPAV